MKRDSVVFFYPTRSVGGAQYLFARMALYLIENTSYSVVLIDYSDGFIKGKLNSRNYDFIEFKDGEAVVIEEPILLVLSLSFMPLIEKLFVLRDTTKLFFWDLHPYNIVEQFALSGIYKRMSPHSTHRICSFIERTRFRKLAQFVEYGLASHGIVFMAGRNKDYNLQLLGLDKEAGYLPIPQDTYVYPVRENFECRKEVGSTIHIGWLSRLTSWKTRVLNRLLDDIKDYETTSESGRIHVHIIGDGPDQDKISERKGEISISMVGRLEGSTLTDYMEAHLHIGFAMGTSALEFAARGIPTVLTPGGMGQDNLNQQKIYRWLFDSQDYNLAAEETDRTVGLRTFSEIIQNVRSLDMAILGEQSRDYMVRNHAIDKVGEMFVQRLSQCSLVFEDLVALELYHYSPFEKLLFDMKKLYKHIW